MGREEVVRRAEVLRVAGGQELPHAHPGAPVEVPRLPALPLLRRGPAEARGAAVADRRGEALDPRRHAHAHLPVPRALRRPCPPGPPGRGDRAAPRGDQDPVRLPGGRGAGIPHAGQAVAHPLGRRGAADQPDHRAGHLAREHAVRARRAEHRASPPRHRAADRSSHAAAGRGQHHPRRRARPRRDPGRRPRAGHGPRPRRAGRAHRVLRHARAAPGERVVAHGRLPDGPQEGGGGMRQEPGGTAGGGAEAPRAADPRRERAQPQEHRRGCPARPPRVRHGRERVGQVDPRAGHPVQRASQARAQARGPAGEAPRASRDTSRSTRWCSSTSPPSAARRGPIP